MSRRREDGWSRPVFFRGGGASFGAQVGATSTDYVHAALLTYSRSRGVFAGVNLKGVVIKPEDELNLAVYGKTAEELLKDPVDERATTESDLNAFPRALNRHTTQS